MVGGAPWCTMPDRGEGEAAMPVVATPMEIPEAEVLERPTPSEVDAVPRWAYLKARDFEEHGYTPVFNGGGHRHGPRRAEEFAPLRSLQEEGD